MSKVWTTPKLISMFLAVLVVFLMTTGAFAGAADKIVGSEKDYGSLELESLSPAEETSESILESDENIIVPDGDPTDGVPAIIPENNDITTESIEVVTEETEFGKETYTQIPEGMDDVVDNNLPVGTDDNEFSGSLEYISDARETESGMIQDTSIEDTRAPLASAQFSFASDNSQYTGQGNGYVYKSGTSYYRSYDGYYMYNYMSGSSYKRRGWSVYDFNDLNQYSGVKITSGYIIWRHDYMRNVKQVDFWTMSKIPYETSTTSTAKSFYEDIAGTSSTKMGTNTFTGSYNYNNFDVIATISSGAITKLNSLLSSSNYDFAMGSDITLTSSASYGYLYVYDARLVLNITYTGMPIDPRGEVAYGDELCGYAYSSSMYDIGRIYSSSSAGGYAVWNVSRLKDWIPTQGPGGENVILTGISVRMNSPYGYFSYCKVYDMSYDPRDYISSPSTIYNDARGGTKYYDSGSSGSYQSTPREFDWELNDDALEDFNDTLDGDPDFFALGFTQSSYLYLYSPKLVVHWKIQYPPRHSLQLGSDNPEKIGQAHGYVYQSSTRYYCYSYYYTYVYKSSTREYHGWATFDLDDLEPWGSVTIKDASIVAQVQYRNYISGINLTTLKTTPYYTTGTTTAKNVFTESGSSGTQIGSHAFTGSSASSAYRVEIPLNSAAVSALQTKLNSTSTYKTFGIGYWPTGLVSGYSYGYMRLNDIRLRVSFEFSNELEPTKNGDKVAFGDDLNGYMYKYTTPRKYEYGYSQTRKSSSSEYRSFVQWDVDTIRRAFEKENVTNVKIKKLGVRFNHRYYGTSGIDIYQVKNNVSDTTDSTLWTDLGDGTKYYSSGSVSSSYNEYEWDLGKDAVSDFQNCFTDNNPDYFTIGITSSSSTYSRDFGYRLIIEWMYPLPEVVIALHDETPEGYEASPVYFNANLTTNVSGGNGALRYEWDFNNDTVWDLITTSPLANYTWYDDYEGEVILRVNDTDDGMNRTKKIPIIIHNVDPEINTSAGKISPQPAYEAGKVTFSGYTVVDPAGVNDKYWYFWDFNGDGEYDVSGACIGNLIPNETWYFEDDFLGKASLLVIDEDGGTTNISSEHKHRAVPPTSGGTGYVYNFGSKYVSSLVYYRWSYSYDYQRGWALFDLSQIPSDAHINKVTFTGYVGYNRSVNMVGVRELSTNPISASGSTVYSEAGSGTRLFGLTGSRGEKKVEMGSTGVTLVEDGMEDGWVGFGFDFETPTSGYNYGYLYGYSYTQTVALEIEYKLERPGYLIQMVVKNRPPVVNCNNMTLTPTVLNEGENITVQNISFCDPGNDTYEYNITVGSYWTGWTSLGGSGLGGGLGIIKNPSFEEGKKDWKLTYYDRYSYIGGEVTTAWSSHGDKSYHLYDRPNTVTRRGDHATITQRIDFTKIETIAFDVKTGELFEFYNFGNPSYGNRYCYDFIAEMLVDNTRVWATDKEYSVMKDIKVNVSTYTGQHDLKFRLFERENGTNIGGHTFEVYFDNIRAFSKEMSGEGGWGAFGPGCHNIEFSLNMTVMDDHPMTGTSWDDVNVTVYVRDDDHHKLVPGTGLGPLTDAGIVESENVYSSGIAYPNSRKVVADSNYNLYTIYTKREGTSYYYQVYVGKSINNGKTWVRNKVSHPKWFGGSYQYYPSLAVDSNDVLHAVWAGGSSGSWNYNIRYANSKDGGETWGEFYNVTSSSSGYRYAPSIAFDKDDNLHVTWYGYETSYPYKIYYINRSATGTWSSMVQVSESTSSESGYMPSIGTDSKGNVHIAYECYNTSSWNYNIRHRIHWNNDTWSEIIKVTDESYYHWDVCLVVDPSDDVHIVWSGYDSVASGRYNIMYNKYTASTGKWGSREYITKFTGYVYQYAPSIAVNGKGEIDVLWYGYQLPGGTWPYVVHRAEKIGTTWNTQFNYYKGTSYQYYPNLFCSPPNVRAKAGYAFVWADYNVLKYWTSPDFEFGNPEFTDGLAWCNRSVRVYNVEPEIKKSALKQGTAFEQEEYEMMVLFDDPAIDAYTEIFEYNINWGDGNVTGWTEADIRTADQLLAGRIPESGYEYGSTIKEEFSYNDQPITYMWAYFFSGDSDTYNIKIDGYNKNTNAWESIYSYYGYSYPGDFERTYSTPIYLKWRIEYADYENNDNIYLEYNYNVENFTYVGGAFFTVSHMYADDMPTNTPWDLYNVSIGFRDDDLGEDYAWVFVNVSDIAPRVIEGDITPDLTYGIDEGTEVSLEYFKFDDVAFKEATETFEYQIDWGDGTTSGGWKSDFVPAGLGGEVFTVESNTQTSNPTFPNSGRNMVMDSDGKLYAVTHHRGTTGFQYEIWCSISEDLGETWTTYEVTTDSSFDNSYQYYASVAIDSKDVLHVVWYGQNTTTEYGTVFYMNSTNGMNWSNLQIINEGIYDYNYPNYYTYVRNYYPVIAVDHDDNVHIAMESYSYFYNYTTWSRRISYEINYTTNKGGSWSPMFQIASWSGTGWPYRYQWRPTIECDSKGNVHVAWYGYNQWTTSRYNIRYRMYNATTSSWEAIYEVTNSTSNYNYYPSITTDVDDNVHLVWYGYPYPYRVYYIKKDAASGTWGTQTRVYTSSNLQYYPTVGTDKRGYVYVTWHGYPYPYKIYVTVDKGSGFETPVQVTQGSQYSYQYYPNIMGQGPHCRALRGAALVWGGQVSGQYDTMFYATEDFFIGKGPLKGIPTYSHRYIDDNPTATPRDDYEITVRVKDDDTLVGECVIPFVVHNVLPEVTSSVTAATANENELWMPQMEFMDPGTGTNEKWHYWWDMNNNGALDAVDLTGPVEDLTVVDNVTYGKTPSVKAMVNDDYYGDAELWVYDDDTPLSYQYQDVLYYPGYKITDATFEAYQWSNYWKEINWSSIGYTNGPITYCKDMSVYQNKAPWTETGVNWTNYAPSTTNMNYIPEDTLTLAERSAYLGDAYPSGGQAHWEAFDISSLTYDWLEGNANNYGISVMPTMINNSILVSGEHTVYYSSGSPSYVYYAYKPKLTIEVDEDDDGNPDTNYVLQPSDGKDAWIGQCSMNLSAMRESGTDYYLLSNLYDLTIGYSSIGSFYRRGLIEFNLSTVSWRKMNSVVWNDHGMNHTIKIATRNVMPVIEIPDTIYVLPTQPAEVECKVSDQGSDDMYIRYDWGDGSPVTTKVIYNNGKTPEPTYPPNHSCFYGTAPFEREMIMSHMYPTEDDYNMTFSIWDDDAGFVGHYNKTVTIHVVSAKELKEEAVQDLEPLIPGHWEVLGYENITLRYDGKIDPTLLVYNYIARPPYYWSEKLFLTVCDVKTGSIIEINGSSLEGGMFGTELHLKLYNDKHMLLDSTDIPTTYSCIEHLEVGQTYGPYTVLGFGEVEGISYHHYSYYALKVEDAMDHILRSLNKDPRRGYGWWHQTWVWWCGEWEFRGLWIDNNRLDPEFGSLVFCEEWYAVQRLQAVILNCLHPEGVWDIEFEYLGKDNVDIEAYALKEDWWNGTWEWIHREYNLNTGDTFVLNGSMRNSTKLGRRIMFRVFNHDTGEFRDNVYVRTSGEWPLEVMPGNVYNELWEISDSTLIIGDNYTYWKWWGDFNWWDIYFDLWSRPMTRGCGWDVDECYDTKVANEEKARVCSNITVLWGVIELLVTADKVLAMMAYSDAENMTVANSSYATDYLYNMKMSKRYFYSAGREHAMGRPNRAISDYKKAWKYAIMAQKFAYKRGMDDELGDIYDNCDDCICFEYPWWWDFYQNMRYEVVEDTWYVAYEDLKKSSEETRGGTRCHRINTPKISPNGGVFTSPVTVTIATTTKGATIYYTTDGSVPTKLSTKYTGSFVLKSTTTVRARAYKPGEIASYIAEAKFVFEKPQAKPPIISPEGGTYYDPVTITLTKGTYCSTMYYTTDGSTPTDESTKYTGPFTIWKSTTVKAIAYKSGYKPSVVVCEEYTLKKQCDYDYNDWGMTVHEKKWVNKDTKNIGQIEWTCVGTVHLASHNHEIHWTYDMDRSVEYKWSIDYYDDEDNLIKTVESKSICSGDFDKIIFTDTKDMVGYKTVVCIDFVHDAKPKHLDTAPYDPYMYDKTSKEYIHVDTMVKPSKLDAMDTDPNIAGVNTPLMLIIDDTGWVWPKDQERIWTKYTKFDDWVKSGFTSYQTWYL